MKERTAEIRIGIKEHIDINWSATKLLVKMINIVCGNYVIAHPPTQLEKNLHDIFVGI